MYFKFATADNVERKNVRNMKKKKKKREKYEALEETNMSYWKTKR